MEDNNKKKGDISQIINNKDNFVPTTEYELNRVLILETFAEMTQDETRNTFPRVNEIARKCGLSVPTVSNHLKEWRAENAGGGRAKELIESCSELILLYAVRMAKKSVPAQRLILECGGYINSANAATESKAEPIKIELDKGEVLDIE